MTTKFSISIIPFLTILITLLILRQFQSQQTQKQIIAVTHFRHSITFLPLKDLHFGRLPNLNRTWFMSSVADTEDPGEPKHLHFPSNSSQGRVLCLAARDHTNGTKNFYAFAHKNSLPFNSTLLRGLTVVSDTYFDYTNIWHGLATVVPFVAWQQKNKCVKPKRWVLFHQGELRTEMGSWVKTVAETTIGNQVKIEKFDRFENVCFERALVFRRNEKGLSRERREQVYDMIRCKARAYCKIGRMHSSNDDMKKIRATLLFRDGGRAFKNETAVAAIFSKKCRKKDGCVLKVMRSTNLTFCDQVRLFSETDIIITPHGAQMANMIFMDKNSSIMEFLPKGWLEFAGVGQHVYRWMAGWAGMRHQGQWKDQEGDDCPYDDNANCFGFYKNGKIGHDEAYFADWMGNVLKEAKKYKSSSRMQHGKQSACHCN